MGRNIVYNHPKLFELMLWMIHGRHLKERYQIIAREIEGCESVLELMCGTALLTQHLPEGIGYWGFDINEAFVRYAQERLSRNLPEESCLVHTGNVDDPTSIRGKEADAVVLIDALHHIQPYEQQQRLIERSARAARKKLVVCDPFGDRYFAMIERFPFLRGAAEWFLMRY